MNAGLERRLGEFPVAVGRLRGVEDHRQMGGLLLADDVEQGGGEDERSRCVQPSGGGLGIAKKSEVTPVHQGHAVEKVELLAVAKAELGGSRRLPGFLEQIVCR